MIRHLLKTWSPFYQDVVDGKKTFEYRKDDRNFAEGDKLHLREFNPATEEFTGKEIIVDVIYKICGGAFGIPDEYCILGIKKTEIAPPNLTSESS